MSSWPSRSWRGAAALSVLAVMNVVASPAAVGQEGTPAPTAASGAASPAPTSSLETPGVEDAPLAVPGAGEVLAPGRYVDSSIGRPFTFEVAEGWTSQGAIEGAGVALIKDFDAGPYVAVVPFDGTVFTDPCRTADNEDGFGPDPSRIDATPEAFVAHLAAHPFLTLTDPVPVEIGGLSGLQVDVATEVPDDCDPPWAWLWVLPVVNDYHLTEDVAARVLALDGGDEVVVLVAEVGLHGDVASLTEASMSVLESIEFGEDQ